MFANVLCVINIPLKFKVESPKETDNSLICKDNIQSQNYEIKSCDKINDKHG